MKDISNEYRKVGVANFYSSISTQDNYTNPHKEYVCSCIDSLFFDYFVSTTKVLDLACGDGLITKKLISLGIIDIDGADYYLNDRYEKETNKKCFKFSFESIANFNSSFNKKYDVIICSYAIDLVQDSYLNKLLYALSQCSDYLLIIRPNSHILPNTYWRLVDEIQESKSHAMLYIKK